MPAIICRDIKTNGKRCQSPSLGVTAFCYFHSLTRTESGLDSQYETQQIRENTQNGRNHTPDASIGPGYRSYNENL